MNSIGINQVSNEFAGPKKNIVQFSNSENIEKWANSWQYAIEVGQKKLCFLFLFLLCGRAKIGEWLRETVNYTVEVANFKLKFKLKLATFNFKRIVLHLQTDRSGEGTLNLQFFMKARSNHFCLSLGSADVRNHNFHHPPPSHPEGAKKA